MRDPVDDRRAGACLCGTDGTNPTDLVHGAAVRAIRDLLRERDVEPDELMALAGLSAPAPDAADASSFAALGRLTALCAERTRCPHFGLMVGQRTTLASFGLLGLLMRHSETIGDALRGLEAHHGLLNRGAVISLSTNGSLALVSYAPYEPDIAGIGLHCERAIAAVTQALRALGDANWAPDEVLLPRVQPTDRQPYAQFFQAPVRFDQEIAALVVPASLLRQPIRDAHPLTRMSVERRLRQIEASILPDAADDLRRRLRVTMADQHLSAEQVARAMAIHRRTLSRRLKAEGTSFRLVARETRLAIAAQLLVDTDLSLAQISAALEFSEPSAFTHAFRRWTGMTPSVWRQERRTPQQTDHKHTSLSQDAYSQSEASPSHSRSVATGRCWKDVDQQPRT